MKFINPAFLFALSAIAIPIIIHLFNFRKYKKVLFTNVRFLKEIKQETQSKSKLKHLLVLASRILFIIFLVLAFAQPYIPSENTNVMVGEKAISIFVDNSFSMDAVGLNGSLFEESRKKAREIAEAYKPTDRFQLLTNDFEGRHQRLVSREEFIELLDEITISPSSRKISEILTRQKDLFAGIETENKLSYILSDFQKNITDLSLVKSDTTVKVRLVPVIASQNQNLYIDSCWFSSPVRKIGQSEELFVKVVNNSNLNYENIPVKLFINGQQKAPAAVSLEPRSSEIISLIFTINETGLNQGVVKITDHPVTFDDDYYFSFKVSPNLPVLSIYGEKENTYIRSLFGNDEFFQYSQVSEKNIDFSLFSSQNLIILNELKTVSSGLTQEIKKYAESGGSVLIFPAKDIDIDNYKTLLAQLNSSHFENLDTADTKVEKINLDHPIFKNVFEMIPENIDLPVIKSHFRRSGISRSDEEALLRLRNGQVMLSRSPVMNGFVYLSSVPLNNDFSNFHRHAIFVPTLYNIALLSQPAFPLSYTIGRDEVIQVGADFKKQEVVKMTSQDGNFEIIPEQKMMDNKMQLLIHDQLKEAGNYTINVSEKDKNGVAFNFDRIESDLTTLSIDNLYELLQTHSLNNFHVLNTQVRDITGVINDINLGKRLWKVCIIFALFFLLLEILLLRFYKR
jgi:hypothetical protein